MRRVGVGLVAAFAAALVPLAPTSTPTAEAARDDIVAIVLEGTGLGHGRGLSQWGAYGWAVDHGKDWTWILDHYYGGTTLGNVNSAQTRIRVRLTDYDGNGTVGLLSYGPGVSWNGNTAASMYAKEVAPNSFQIFSSTSIACPSSNTLSVPDGPIAQGSTNSSAVTQIQQFLNAFRVNGDAFIAVDGDFGPQTAARLTDWQGDQGLPANAVWDTDDAARARQLIGSGSGSVTWTSLGTFAGPIVFTSPNSETSSASPATVLGVCDTGGDVNHYRGTIEVRSENDGNRVVNDVKTEDYLRGVVPKEISASWADAGNGKGINSVRAQAVAARSYALTQNRYAYASTCDTPSCQVYGGSATRTTATSNPNIVEDARTDKGIADTAGKVRKWPNGNVVSTEFSASNGPRTAGGAFPPVDDAPGDSTSRNPNHRWTRILDADALESKYGLGQLTSASMIEAASSTYRQFDGIWFNDIVLTGTSGTHRQQAWDFRNAHGLPSPGFTVRVITEDTSSTQLALIGDSVGESIAGDASSELRRLIDGTFPSPQIHVLGGRCTAKTSCIGASGVQVAKGLPTGLDLVVVELGYNDWPPDFAGDIDAMMSALSSRGVRQVAWVNMADIRLKSGGGSYYAQANAALDAAAAAYSNLTILDWDTASDTPERDRWFSDGVHLTTTGQAEFALWLREQILTLAPSHYLAPPKVIKLPVVGASLTAPNGAALTVPADASGVALNVTAVDPALRGFVTAWPCGVDRPLASNLNYPGGTRVANAVIAPIGTDGSVCLYSHRGTDLVVDIAGWFAGPTQGVASFVGATPTRLVDTRDGTGGRTGLVAQDSPVVVPIHGRSVPLASGAAATVPNDIDGVALNVTVVDPIRNGHVTVYPCDVPKPVASNVNFSAGDRIANGVVSAVAADGTVCIYAHTPTQIVVDVVGWFGGSAASGGGSQLPAVGLAAFTAATPERVIDTRDGTGGRATRVTPSTPLVVPVRGRQLSVNGSEQAVPADAAAVALNLTIVDPLGQGFATVWPCGVARPEASNINYLPNRRVANSVIAPIGVDGTVCVYTHRETHVVLDIAGWYAGGDPAGFVGATPDRMVDTRYAIGPMPS